jgi:NitT/TauT family transport system permease protein
VAFLISFFPIVIASVVALRAIEQEMLELARSLNASERQIFLKFRLPRARPLRASQRTSLQSSLPNLIKRVQGRIGQAVIGAVVGEFIAAEGGLDYLQIVSRRRCCSGPSR